METAISQTKRQRIIVFGPGIHKGGGRLLLDSLLPELDRNCDIVFSSANDLDRTTKSTYSVRRTAFAWIAAQWHLRKLAQADDIVLAFSSLPPFFGCKGRVVIFFQNDLLIDGKGFKFWLRRSVLRLRYKKEMPVICQTEVTAAKLLKKLNIRATSVPFLPRKLERYVDVTLPNTPLETFLYPASGNAHKNHSNLLAAWCQVASAIAPSRLILTIDPDHPVLAHLNLTKLRIDAIGWQPFFAMSDLYRKADALIFPSLNETLALPLLEAASAGCVIFASDRPFASQFIEPEAQFDPNLRDGIETTLLNGVLYPPADRAAKIAANRERVAELPTPGFFLKKVVAEAQ